jgi:transcriptional regulator with GAF, ATPase, and Fis domain
MSTITENMAHALALDAVADDGLEVVDIRNDAAFASRQLHVRDVVSQMAAMERLGRTFVERPDDILQELADAAIDLCGADSSGISIVQDDAPESEYYKWVATAGAYKDFMDATLPRYPSACGVCIERGQPQLFRVRQRFFDILGVEAPQVTDGILLPWEVDSTRGTIFVMAHGRSAAFDRDDCQMMQTLASFAALGVRQLALRKQAIEQMSAAAAASMANDLAHQINNPLQSLTNQIYIASQSTHQPEVAALARSIEGDLGRLSELVGKLLAIPIHANKR